MSFFEFPHARTYDSDLGWLIRHFGLMSNQVDALATWAATHKTEYDELNDKVEGLINNLVDVISPWDSSIAYHIFSIVEYQGTNYIAIQDVPVGAMITNTDYWQPANTALEQINAIGVTVDEVKDSVENIKYWYYPEEFGAVGDGETDDSAAFQTMFDTVPENALIVLKSDEYYLASPVSTAKSYLRISGIERSEYKPRIVIGHTGVGITFTGTGYSLSDFTITRREETKTATLIYFNADNDVVNGNIDAIIDNMCFYYSYTAILCRGRNVQLTNSLISTSERGIHIVNTELDTDNRGYDIRQNRFHYCPTAIYYLITNTRELRNANIEGNFFDGCNVMFQGYGDNVSIRNNFFDAKGAEARTGIIQLLANASPQLCVIANNVIKGDTALSFYFIHDAAGCITDVMNNDISNIYTEAMQVLGTANIINNIIRRAAVGVSGYYPVVYAATGSGHCYGNLLVDCDKTIVKASGSPAVIVNNYPA